MCVHRRKHTSGRTVSNSRADRATSNVSTYRAAVSAVWMGFSWPDIGIAANKHRTNPAPSSTYN